MMMMVFAAACLVGLVGWFYAAWHFFPILWAALNKRPTPPGYGQKMGKGAAVFFGGVVFALIVGFLGIG